MCKVDLQGWAVVLIEPGNGIQVQLHCAVKVPKAQVEVGEVDTHEGSLRKWTALLLLRGPAQTT